MITPTNLQSSFVADFALDFPEEPLCKTNQRVISPFVEVSDDETKIIHVV